ncbi:tRNA splicing endonuclease [Halovivax asiaticus JCM 14624]|uniref:tRNA-splicing endonuclease n=1 Tax=Halovivax asiaticus JCM 14624 TaxID=1227490 RepID=M0BGY7_9EURY|nr:tRNA-intron lyase [Halovivax asiaticus]ELZ10110.1 tRNA splicing endonuclease [Halovivax asiaticus JCM 14624]
MEIEGAFDGDVVRIGGDARQRFHDARGYGYPLSGNEIALSPVEAAHLLYTDNIDGVRIDGERVGFRGFTAREPGTDFAVRYLVYADLRARGLYLSPAREPWIDPEKFDHIDDDTDFAVYPRGKGPNDGELEYALRVLGERTDVPATALEPGVLAVVDEESEITYLEVATPTMTGDSVRVTDPGVVLPGDDATEPPGTSVAADLLEDRVVIWDPPTALYERTFYGQPLEGREYDGETPTIQCSLLEAAHLAAVGVLDLDPGAVRKRGRAVEGDRFDRRLRVYTALRERGVVPKTGYKFGADFRTYVTVDTVDDLGHSEHLIRVVPSTHDFEPRDLSLDVRLAHGVRKTMVVALVTDEPAHPDDPAEGISWWSVERLTP